MSSKIKRFLPWILCLFSVGFFFSSNWKPLFVWEGRTDLEIVTRAADNLLHGRPVYVHDDLWQHTKPPLATLLFVPLSFVDNSILWPLWDWLNVVTLFAMALFLARGLLKNSKWSSVATLAALGVLSVTNFYLYEIRYGQYNMITLALIVMAAHARRSWMGATALVFAGLIKPTNVLFLPWVLKQQAHPTKLAAQSLAVTLLLCGLYGGLFGFANLIEDHKTWSHFIGMSTEKYLYREVNYGIPSALSSLTNSKALHHMLLLFGLLLGALLARRTNRHFHLGLCAVLSLALSPMTWWANFCILLPLSIWILKDALRQLRESRGNSINSWLDLLILYSGTQLIFPNYLPDFIMHHIPRMANPVWVYLIYFAKTFLLKRWPLEDTNSYRPTLGHTK